MERLTRRGWIEVLVALGAVVTVPAAAQDAWTLTGSVAPVFSVAADPLSPNVVYAGLGDGVSKSTDAGATWTASGAGLPGAVTVLVVDPGETSRLYALSAGALYRSSDAAASWTLVHAGNTWLTVTAVALERVSGALYISIAPYCFEGLGCVPGGGIEKSTDGGETWTSTPIRRSGTAIAAAGSNVYATVAGGLVKSVDGGASWAPTGPPGLRFPIRALAIDPLNGTIYLGSGGDGVFRSRDSGITWERLNVGLPTVTSLAIDPRAPLTILARTESGVFRSTSGGAVWSLSLPSRVSDVDFAATSPSVAYAAGNDGLYRVTFGASDPCEAAAPYLCLGGGRFLAGVAWRSPRTGASGVGQAVGLSEDTGYFWFFEDGNVELVVKVLDGTALNGSYWLFSGGLSDVEYTLVVTDTATGQTRTLFNPGGSMSSFADTSAFPATGGSSVQTVASPAVASISATAYPAPADLCADSPTVLCVNRGRFRVAVSWRTKDGRSGDGRANALTPDTGDFWFFDAANVELVVKVLDGRSFNGHYWVFYGALSDVAYTITVTDAETGAVRTYDNPQGALASRADTEAF